MTRASTTARLAERSMRFAELRRLAVRASGEKR